MFVKRITDGRFAEHKKWPERNIVTLAQDDAPVIHPKLLNCPPLLIDGSLSKYPKQQILVVAFNDYVFLVPFVEEAEYYCLKTIIPSRKATKDSLQRRHTHGKI